MQNRTIILGGGLGGLSAAIHARLYGHQVTLLERQAAVGGKAAQVEESGFVFDPGPSIVIMPWVYEDVFKRANKNINDYIQFQKLDEVTKIYFEEKKPFTIPWGIDRAKKAVKEHIPEDYEAFCDYLNECEEIYKLTRKAIFTKPFYKPWHLIDYNVLKMGAKFRVARVPYKELIDEKFKSDMLRALFYGFPTYNGQHYMEASIGGYMMLYIMISEGVLYPQKGIGGIIKGFEKLAEELGVSIIKNADVFKLVTKENNICQVAYKINNQEKLLTSDIVISNIDKLTTQKLYGQEIDVKPSFSYCTLQLGLNKKLEGFVHHNQFIPKEYERAYQELYDDNKVPDKPLIYMNITSKTDLGTAPSNHENLFFVISSPSENAMVDLEFFLQNIKSYGLEIKHEEIVYSKISTPKFFETAHGNYKGSLYGPTKDNRFMKILSMTNVDENFNNLFYVGGSVQPGAGLPMVVLSGKYALDIIESRNL